LIDRKIYRAVLSGGSGFGLPERVVELRYLTHLLGSCNGAILDVGYAHAMKCHYRILARYKKKNVLVGVDPAPRRAWVHRVYDWTAQYDVCNMGFPDAMFDLVVCISTLEHIGLDGYGVTSSGTARKAVEEMCRVLRPRGRILITVPFGRARDYGWFRVYDTVALLDYIQVIPNPRIMCHAHTDAGWVRTDAEALADVDYYSQNNAGAAAVAIIIGNKT